MAHYNEIRNISICEFLPPHLTIYVDVPSEEVQKRLKQSGKVTKQLLGSPTFVDFWIKPLDGNVISLYINRLVELFAVLCAERATKLPEEH